MSVLRPLVDFWVKPIRAEPLALFRILLGLTILGAQLTGILVSLDLTCGPEGLRPIEVSDVWIQHQGRTLLLRGPVSLPLLGKWLPKELVEKYPRLGNWLENWVPAPAQAAWEEWGERLSSHYLLFGIYLGALVFLTLGFRSRLMALVAALLAATFHHRLPELMNGGDSLFRNGLYYLILAPSGATWSLDHLLRRRRARARGEPISDEPVLIEPWSVRLMQLQLCFVYLFTGLVKLGEDYFNGVAIYWVLNDTAVSRWPYGVVPIPLFVCRLMTWGTLAFELTFIVLIWIKPLRRWIILAGLGLHLGILATMEIGWFSQVTMCWYALFVSGETLGRWERRGEGVSRVEISPQDASSSSQIGAIMSRPSSPRVAGR